jgi:hypothetical protein
MMYFILYIMSVSKHINGISVEADEEILDNTSHIDGNTVTITNITNHKSKKIKLEELLKTVLKNDSKEKFTADKCAYIILDNEESFKKLVSCLMKYCGDDIFKNPSIEHNYKSDSCVKSDVIEKYIPSSKFLNYIKDKDNITLKEIFYFFLTTPDDAPMGNNYYFARILFDFFHFEDIEDVDSEELLPDYNLLKACKPFNALYELIEPRYETRVICYALNYINSIPFFNDPYIRSQFKIETQFKINDIVDRYYDLAIIMKNKGCKCLFEVHEDNSNHMDNPNDLNKKMIAVGNKYVITYFRENDYNSGKRSSALERMRSDLHDNLAALIFNQDVECRRIYLQYCYKDILNDEAKMIIDKLEQTDKSNVKEINRLYNVIQSYKDKLNGDGMEDLLKFFEWKKLSQDDLKDKGDGKVVKLSDVFDLIEIDAKDFMTRTNTINSYGDLMKLNNDNEYMINWKILAKIINKYSGDENRQDQLFSYFLSVEDTYERIRELEKKYEELYKDLDFEYKEYQKKKRLYLPTTENKNLRSKLEIIESQVSIYENTVKNLRDIKNAYDETIESYDELLSLNGIDVKNHITTQFKNAGIKFNELIELYNLIKNKQNMDQYILFNITNTGKPLLPNRPDIKIYWNNNSCKIIKCNDLIALLEILKVQKSIAIDTIKTILGENTDLTTNPDITRLDIMYDNVPLTDNIKKTKKLQKKRIDNIDVLNYDLSKYIVSKKQNIDEEQHENNNSGTEEDSDLDI